MIWHALVEPAFYGRLCLTLLHSVWLAALFALVAWCADRLFRNRAVERRYAANVAALLATMAALPITYAWIEISERPVGLTREVSSRATLANPGPAAVGPATTDATTEATTEAALAVPAAVPGLDSPPRPSGQAHVAEVGVSPVAGPTRGDLAPNWLWLAPWCVAIYAAGVVLMLARLAKSIHRAHRLVTRADVVTDGPLVDTLRSLADTWSMRVVPTLARTERIVAPTLIGLARPTILLPASALSGLTTDELEMILAHELAHVRRYDMWVNLLQRLAEAVLFFNPAVWWLSRRTSMLREYCCDEMTCRAQAAKAPEPRVRYATALLRVVELAKPTVAAKADLASLAASGRSPSELRRRVARLFGEPLREPLRVSRGGALTLVLLGAALAVGLPAWHTHAQAPTDRADAESEDTPFTIQLHVVGPDGAPVPQAQVEFRAPKPTAEQIQTGEFLRAKRYGTVIKTSDEGELRVTLPRRPPSLTFGIEQPGYGPYWAEWSTTRHPSDIPLDFTARLDDGWSVGGVVVDGSARPVAGVKVHPSIEFKKRPGDTGQMGVGTTVTTDAEGKWRYDCVPASKSDVAVEVSHQDFAPLRPQLPRNGFGIPLDGTPSARIELQRGLTVKGRVTDEAGRPITDALVRTKFLNDIREAKTNQQGEYQLVGCEPLMARLVVSATGRATDMQNVRIEPDMATVDFSLKAGGRIRVRVVDEQGKGIPKARIFFQRWRGRYQYFEFDHINQYADKNGVWEWNEAPLDEFQADICRPGGMQLSRQPLIAREEEYVFQPPSALIVSGRVVDAKTKETVKSFRVTPGLRNEDPRIGMNWIPRESYEAKDGAYRIQFRHDYPAHLVRIEAEGYLTAISRDILTDEGEVSFDFELQPAKDISATILTAVGEPAAQAKVALGVAGSQINVQNGDIDDSSTYATRLDADHEGRFSIPARDVPFQLVITHPAGYAYLKSADGPIPARITLIPWARVEGVFRVGPRPAPNVELDLSSEPVHSYGEGVPNIFTHHSVITGKEGRFVFDRVFPGKGRISRSILLTVDEGAMEVTSSQRVAAEFIAGETITLELGGKGRAVLGKLAMPAEHSEKVHWSFALVYVEADLKAPPSPTAPENVRNDPARRRAWWESWRATDEGQAWGVANEAYERLRSHAAYMTASVDRDGSFRVDDVPDGHYVLKVHFSRDAPGNLAAYHFAVPPTEEGRSKEPLDLGTLTLKKQ